MDWGAGHLTIIVGTGGGAFANKNLNNFFKCPGYTRGEGCSRLELTRTLVTEYWGGAGEAQDTFSY